MADELSVALPEMQFEVACEDQRGSGASWGERKPVVLHPSPQGGMITQPETDT
jgi:hypothetical protein